MALPQHKTCLSILRSILGPGAGNESRFAEKIGRSTSWLKKASCGQIQLTNDAAVRIGYETGVNVRWLMAGDTNSPPVDDQRKPYNIETYAAHRELMRDGFDSSDASISEEDITIILHKILQTYVAARSQNRGGLFTFKLENAVYDFVMEFGSDEIASSSVALGIVENLQKMITLDQISVWNLGSSNARLKLAGVNVEYTASSGDPVSKKRKPKPQKKQPSRKKP